VQWARGAYLGPPLSVLVAIGIWDSTFPSSPLVAGVSLWIGHVIVDGGSWRVLGTGRLSSSFVLAQ